MNQKRGILCLQDPQAATQNRITGDTEGLVFHENESLLSQAQGALLRLRERYGWICIAAEGSAAHIALALAAQLPVDRLALLSPGRDESGLSREMLRLRSYARRNLALITAEILLWDAEEDLIRSLLRGNRHSRLCLLERYSPEALTQPWDALMENNLLIRGKCV